MRCRCNRVETVRVNQRTIVCRRSSRQSIARLIRLRSRLHPPPGSGNFASMILRAENSFTDRNLIEAGCCENHWEALSLLTHRPTPHLRQRHDDTIMPVMGGKVMAEWLQTIYPELKILFTSGYTDDALLNMVCLRTESSSCPNLIRRQSSPAKCAPCWIIKLTAPGSCRRI